MASDRPSRPRGAPPSDAGARRPRPGDDEPIVQESFPVPGAQPPRRSRAADMLDRMKEKQVRESAEGAPPARSRRDARADARVEVRAAARADAAPAAQREEKRLGRHEESTNRDPPDDEESIFESASMYAQPTLTVSPPRHPPARQPKGDLYAVILDPRGRVQLDRLIEAVAAFRGEDIRTTRRAIRHGKGLLATDLDRSAAMVLESALSADGQPVRVVRMNPREMPEPPRAVDAIETSGREVHLREGVRVLPLRPEELRLLSAGVVYEGDAGDGQVRLVCDLFGYHRSEHWRWMVTVPAEDVTGGRLGASARGFFDAMRALGEAVPLATRTQVFETIAEGNAEPRHYFPTIQIYDNYQQWMLWAHFRPAG